MAAGMARAIHGIGTTCLTQMIIQTEACSCVAHIVTLALCDQDRVHCLGRLTRPRTLDTRDGGLYILRVGVSNET